MKKIPKGDGYDIVIWQKSKNSPTWGAAYTPAGAEILKGAIGQKVEITEHPAEFMPRVYGKKIRVGGLNPDTNKIELLWPPRGLH